MCQVVAYRRLKTIENSKTVCRRLREVVLYERFQYKALTKNMFGVLRRWSLMGGGRLREVVVVTYKAEVPALSLFFCKKKRSWLSWRA